MTTRCRVCDLGNLDDGILVSITLPTLALRKGKRQSPWLTLNDRDHWARRKRLTSYYREEGRRRAEELHLPHLDRVRVFAWISYGNRRILDPHNYTLTAKAVIDGFVDYGLVPDDNSKHLIGPDMRRDERLARGLVMQIIPLEAGHA